MHFRSLSRLTAAAVVLLAAAGSVLAAVSIPLVPVGDAGNPADRSGHGSVDHAFRIGACEITRGQYAAFLNAVAALDTQGLYDTRMGIARSGMSGYYTYTAADANKPVAYVTWYTALRFVNWLHNGQPAGPPGPGTTEDGAYALTGAAPGVRKAGALFFLPSEDEWFKAAYYQGGANGAYTLYPTRSDILPAPSLPPGTANAANYSNVAAGASTDVGAYAQSRSAYGTCDQAGNVWEWTETLDGDARPVVRGGSFDDYETLLQSWYRDSEEPLSATAFVGFRVAAAASGEQPGNRVPAASADAFETEAGVTLAVTVPGVLANDSDPDGDVLTAAQASGPAHGALTLRSDGSFSYTPAAGFAGTDSFSYTVNDGKTDGSTVAVTLTVRPPATAYTLSVRRGSGDGTYAPGTVVTIRARAPEAGYVFRRWTGDVAAVSSVTSATTTVTMPARNATVTATYQTILEASFKITRAEWDREERDLRVSGTGPVGKTVSVSIAGGKTLGTRTINSNGKWNLRVEGISPRPDRVRAVCAGVARQADVTVKAD